MFKALIKNNFFLGLILAFILGTPIAWAETSSWVQMYQFRWYNSKYIFVDIETGFLVVELAEERRNGGFYYIIEAVDCGLWVSYPLTDRDEDQDYIFYSGWKTNPSGPVKILPGSPADFVAKNLCPDRYKFPRKNIPE